MLGLFVFPNSHVNLQGQEHAALQRLLQKAGDELPSVCSVFKDKGYTAKNEMPVVQAFQFPALDEKGQINQNWIIGAG